MANSKNTANSAGQGVPLLELATAFKSLRDSGFDFATAVGEPVDNAIQANAHTVDLYITKKKDKTHETITSIAIVDDGDGMDLATAQGCFQLGFSTRYDDRTGLGRFGVGATLAAISQCKRISLYSKTLANDSFISTYIDLDEIANNSQSEIPVPKQITPPKQLSSLIDLKKGTVVIWEKCDRLEKDPNGRPIDAAQLLEELCSWLTRAYRYPLREGLVLRINGEPLRPYDPLYLKPHPDFAEDPTAEIRFNHPLEWDVPGSSSKKSVINVIITLLPKSLRLTSGHGRRPAAVARRIHENEGISILRHNREVAFGNFYPMTPTIAELDRWWGCEIHFEPELDECWEVRNVKRGARPTKELREAIRILINKRITDIRKEISDDWRIVEANKATEEGIHTTPEEIVSRVETTMKPSTEAAKDLSNEEKEKLKLEIIKDPDLPIKEQEKLENKINKALPITIKTKAMAGAEFIETAHLGNGQIVLTFNNAHPFFSEIYSELEQLEQSNDGDGAIALLAMKVRFAVDLLLMSYGRAESMIDLNNPIVAEAITELRSYWGVQLRKYINELDRQ